MRSILKFYFLSLCILSLAVLVGDLAVSRSNAVLEAKKFEEWVTEFRATLLFRPEIAERGFLRSMSAVSGHTIVVFLYKGAVTSDEELLATEYERFEESVGSSSTEDVVCSVAGETTRFRSIPIAAHPNVRQIFVELPRPQPLFMALPGVDLLLLAAAVIIASLLATLLWARVHVLPLRELTRASELAAQEEKIDIPYLDDKGRKGDLARSIRKLIASLKRKQARLVENERVAVFRQVTAGIAHEVRNPLTAMRMTAQMLRKQLTDEQSQERLQVIVSEIDRLKNHMDQLMKFGGQYEPTLAPTDIVELVRDILLLMRRQLEHARITVVTSFGEELPPVFADADQIRQVLINIVLNSVQAMPQAGTLTISVNTAKVEGEPVCTIAVEDTGPGIPENAKDKVFEPFFSTKKAGTGLGLSIARQIVEMHGGRIRFVTSERGTIFRLFLPMSPDGRRLDSIATDHFRSLEGSNG